MTRLERDLDLLRQAARVSPVLLDAVARVEQEVRLAYDGRAAAWQSYEEADRDAEDEKSVKWGYKMALRQILDVPSQHDLMTNAVARAMYEYASRAIEGDRRHVG